MPSKMFVDLGKCLTQFASTKTDTSMSARQLWDKPRSQTHEYVRDSVECNSIYIRESENVSVLEPQNKHRHPRDLSSFKVQLLIQSTVPSETIAVLGFVQRFVRRIFLGSGLCNKKSFLFQFSFTDLLLM